MPTSNIIVPARQYFVPDQSIITLDSALQSPDAYHLTGLLPQETSLKFTRIAGKIRIDNVGKLAVTWIEVDSPYRFTKIEQTCLCPDGFHLFTPVCGKMDSQYIVFNAYDGGRRTSSGKIYPLSVRLCIDKSDGNKFHIEYYF